MAAVVTTIGPKAVALSTPEKLWVGLWAIWILDLLLLVTMIGGIDLQQRGLQEIGRDTAPSIIHAQRIKTALADMDANAANELLLRQNGPDAVKAFEDRRTEAAESLIEAARNITFGEAESKPILEIQVTLGKYQSLIQRARDLHAEGNPAAYVVYKSAASLLDNTILTAADRLDKANLDELEKRYERTEKVSTLMVALIAALGIGFVGSLFLVQVYLARRMKRLLNPALAAATVLTLGFFIYSLVVLADSRHQLKIAREDAFPSVHALWRAKALAYSANAEESRFLLDNTNTSATDSFIRKTDLIAKIPPGETAYSIADAALNSHDIMHFTGYLSDELNNITFPGEREAAVKALRAFGVYIDIDRRIRLLESKGQHEQAVELCVGTKPDQSNGAFDHFDSLLDETLNINQTEFSTAIDRGFRDLDYFNVKAAVLAVIVAGLSMYGMLQRIREYR